MDQSCVMESTNSPLGATIAASTVHDEDEYQKELAKRRIHLIKTSWRAVKFGLDVKATQIFYERLFDEFPMVRPMFKDDMKVQYNKLFSAVSLAVDCLDDLDNLVPVLAKLGAAHAGYGVVRAHYEAVTECFIWTLNSYILSQMPNNNAINWLFEVTDAWEWVLTLIGKVMADAGEAAADEAADERWKRRQEQREEATEPSIPR